MDGYNTTNRGMIPHEPINASYEHMLISWMERYKLAVNLSDYDMQREALIAIIVLAMEIREQAAL